MSASAARPDRFVFDSFALLAYLQDEPGGAAVEELLEAAASGRARVWLSIVNFGEVLYVVERVRGLEEAHRAAAAIDSLPIRVVDADRELTFAAAHVKANRPLAYADAFAAALSLRTGGAVVTGDPEFRRVEDLVPIRWVGG